MAKKSSFLTNSVDFSVINNIKNILKPHLINYNSFYEKNCEVSEQIEHFIIPNNNNKMFMFCIKKSSIINNEVAECTSRKDTNMQDYLILYFFKNVAEGFTNQAYFCIETELHDKTALVNCLFEGYLYNNSYYSITDILVNNGVLETNEFSLRHYAINELNVFPLNKLNNSITVSIHPVFSNKNMGIIEIFRHNFVHHKEIAYVEHIYNCKKQQLFIKIQYSEHNEYAKQNEIKSIIKTQKPDVYYVYDTKTNEFEGLLYIKTLKDSIKMKSLDWDLYNNKIQLECSFNNTFLKWQPIL